VLDVDISKYYDTIQHHHLRAFLDRRVTDGVIRRMIDKWLKAGVLEHDLLRHMTEGLHKVRRFARSRNNLPAPCAG